MGIQIELNDMTPVCLLAYACGSKALIG